MDGDGCRASGGRWRAADGYATSDGRQTQSSRQRARHYHIAVVARAATGCKREAIGLAHLGVGDDARSSQGQAGQWGYRNAGGRVRPRANRIGGCHDKGIGRPIGKAGDRTTVLVGRSSTLPSAR
ncbi:hypothetical protein SDC9_90363 [bioreactor metagenome]|uniref:Uncharacterized protein n=1 Tax=bioreactor metagenome TaxID=1076179 RepID=A0A644ZSG8_9ZZZZ